MPVFLIANPKGGVGKSTVATNLAGYFARRGERTMLGDLDRQQSSRAWLALRPRALPKIDTAGRISDSRSADSTNSEIIPHRCHDSRAFWLVARSGIVTARSGGMFF